MPKLLSEQNVFEELGKFDLDNAYAFLSMTVHLRDGKFVATATAFTAFDGGPLPHGHRIMEILVEGAREAAARQQEGQHE